MGDSEDLYSEVEETQLSKGEEGGVEWSELKGVMEAGGSGKGSRRENNVSRRMDNELTTNGGGREDHTEDNKNQREMEMEKAVSVQHRKCRQEYEMEEEKRKKKKKG